MSSSGPPPPPRHWAQDRLRVSSACLSTTPGCFGFTQVHVATPPAPLPSPSRQDTPLETPNVITPVETLFLSKAPLAGPGG